LNRELAESNDLRRDWKYRLALGPTRVLNPKRFVEFVLEKNAEAQRLFGYVGMLINEALQDAVGAPGQSSDADDLIYVAARLGALYRSGLQWKLDFLRIDVDPQLKVIRELAACLCDNAIGEIEAFARALAGSISEALVKVADGSVDGPITVNLSLNLTTPDISELERECASLSHLVSSGMLQYE
jgi:hypothetical protein